MEDLPSELIHYVTDHLGQPGDLAAFARTSRRFHNIVEPILYKFANVNLAGHELLHPLRWAAEFGQAGTMKKALLAGVDANLLLGGTLGKKTRDMQSFPSSVEGVHGIWGLLDWDHGTEHDHLIGRMQQWTWHDQRQLYQQQANVSREDEQDGSSVGFQALHLAARGGYDHVVQILLENGADIEMYSGQLCTCKPGHARLHADYHGVPLNGTRIPRFSPLHLAICHFQATTAKLLLSQGASIRMSDPGCHSAATALHVAAATGQVDLCKHLLDGGYVPDVDVLDSSNLTPFYYAYFNGHWDTTVAFLLERGANIELLIRHTIGANQAQADGLATILFEACAFGRYEDAMKLIHLGADVSKGQYRDGVQLQWPLHAACQPPRHFVEPLRSPPLKLSAAADTTAPKKRVELIEMMLRQGADIEAKSSLEGETPLHYAAKHELVSALRALLAAGAKVESRNHRGQTPLMGACLREPRQARPPVHVPWCRLEENPIKSLLDHGLSINAKDNDGNTALHLACSSYLYHRDEDASKQGSKVRLLLERGANGSVRNKLGVTPFEIAFMRGSLPICDVLVRRRTTVQSLRHEDLDRMLLASFKYWPTGIEALDLLLDLDVDGFLYSKSDYIMSLVKRDTNMACAYLGRELMKCMLAMKVPVNSVNKDGHTPLYAVVSKIANTWRDGFVMELLDAGADIHLRPGASSLMTPLEKAIANREEALVELMLCRQPLHNDSHAVLSPLAPKGVYLHAAARAVSSKRVFSALIRSGASVTELDANGDTPLSVFLKSLIDQPAWIIHEPDPAKKIRATIGYLWNKDVDIHRRNKAGKSISSYAAALMLYDGDDTLRTEIARAVRRYVGTGPFNGFGDRKESETSEFHRPGSGAVKDQD